MDYGERMTEKAFSELAEDLRKTYAEAEKDLLKKMESFTQRHKRMDAQKRALLKAGKITEGQYKTWMTGQVFTSRLWAAKMDQMAESLLNANRNALNIIGDKQIDVYAKNANYFDFKVSNDVGMRSMFNLYDHNAVSRLIGEKPELMPRKVIDKKTGERSDKAWNRKIMANCVTQGIIQGESIAELARRIARETASKDEKAMLRYARTAMTAAQNAGRMQGLNNALDMGIRVKKGWMAMMDERTRPAHEMLDGQEEDVNEPFSSMLGPIMYPGDPNAADENVWNCRCCLVYSYLDYPNHWDENDGEAYEEWEEEQEEE